MQSKNLSTPSTTRTTFGRQESKELMLHEQNKRLQFQLRSTREELSNVKYELLRVYEENVALKQGKSENNEQQFMRQCNNEINRLRRLVEDLMQTKSIAPSEREQIKDRIIMKLEDELISTKIALKEAKGRQN